MNGSMGCIGEEMGEWMNGEMNEWINGMWRR